MNTQKKLEQELFRAELAWWKQHRPVSWGARTHRETYAINTIGKVEARLAQAVVLLLEEKRQKKVLHLNKRNKRRTT